MHDTITETQWTVEDLDRLGSKISEFAKDPFHTTPEKRLLLRLVSEAVRRFETYAEVTVT